MAERAVGAMMVIVVLPSRHFLSKIIQRDELMHVEEFVTQSAIE
jgi:hypothetical protein